MSYQEFAQEGDAVQNARAFARDCVQIPADLLISKGPRFRVWVLDLSQSGFRIETANHIDINQTVYLTIPNFQPFQARVAWNHKEQYGCELTNKIYDAVFTHIAAAFPALMGSKN